jgi:hypothetical protein
MAISTCLRRSTASAIRWRPEYQALTDAEAHVGYIHRISAQYRRAAKDVLISEFPDLVE